MSKILYWIVEIIARIRSKLELPYMLCLSLLSLFVSATGILFIYQGAADGFFMVGQAGISLQALADIVKSIPKTTLLLEGTIIFIMTMALGTGAVLLPPKAWNLIYKFRYAFGAAVFIVCVLLELSGSSISYWGGVLPGVDRESMGTLFHSANPMRSDEFAVNTVFAIAQEVNVGQNYPYFSDIVRAVPTDMFIVYGQPTLSYGMIFRPFQVGYLLFGSAKGLSFFWCGRQIALIMISFEFGMAFLKSKKPIAVFYSILVSYSPMLCWWFAVNGLVEMLVFGQACALLIRAYMKSRDRKKRCLYSLLFFWCGGCYILVFYPAWQIALGYVFLILFLWAALENRKGFEWKWSNDLPIILAAGAVVGALLIMLFVKSWDTISLVMNTAYPGKRVSVDKISLTAMFDYGYNMFLPLVESLKISQWVFIDFFPVGIIMALYTVFFAKKRDVILIGLLLLDAFFLIIYTCQVPVAVLKITLLSYVPGYRALAALGFINILLVLRSMVFIGRPAEKCQEERNIKCKRAAAALLYGLVLCLCVRGCVNVINCTKVMYVIMFVFFSFSAFVILSYKENRLYNLFLAGIGIIIILDGCMVNPLQQGLDFIFDNELVARINSIAEEDDGKWLVDSLSFPANNIPLFAGARVINCTNVYPQMATWRKLDADGRYEECYNRYAHITADITGEETSFELLYPDQFKVNVRATDLEILEVSYVLTTRGLEEYSDSNVLFEQIYECGEYYIYHVSYAIE